MLLSAQPDEHSKWKDRYRYKEFMQEEVAVIQGAIHLQKHR